MKAHDFDVIARRAATGISRRDSLMPMGGAALAALAVPAATAAKRKGKKSRKKCKKKVRQTCRRQGDKCRAYFIEFCPDQDCRDRYLPCCEDLATCNTNDALTCFFPPEEP